MTRRTTRTRRVATAVPLALVSAAWTTHLASAGPTGASTAVSSAPSSTPGQLPDGSSMPGAPVEYPASLSQPDAATDAGDQDFTGVVPAVSTGEIPSAALAAYQRAETVINAADPGCRLSWQLVAAVGRVESHHGSFGGSTLGADGVATPAIVGPPLNGRNGTALIADTDAGQYDGDPTYDRAVGPMQFIPSTWAVVGVDADNDGFRNPQDIDDASLAAAVYLCSGTEDLSQAPGQRGAVYRYNHSDSYVDLVLSIMNDYLAGNFGTGPSPSVSAGYVDTSGTTPDVVGPPLPEAPLTLSLEGGDDLQAVGELAPLPTTVGEPTDVGGGTAEPAEPTGPELEVPTDEPSSEPSEEPTGEPFEQPSGEPTEVPTETPTEAPLPDPAPVLEPMTYEDAVELCAGELGLVDDLDVADDDYDLCLVDPAGAVPPPAAPAGGTTLTAGRSDR